MSIYMLIGFVFMLMLVVMFMLVLVFRKGRNIIDQFYCCDIFSIV